MLIGKLRWFLLSIMMLVSLACAQTLSESDARQILEKSYRNELKYYHNGEELQVRNFHKTDGLAEVENGAEYYTMDYQAEIIFPKEYGNFKAGEGYKEEGRLRVVRTENGWRLVEQQTLKRDH